MELTPGEEKKILLADFSHEVGHSYDLWRNFTLLASMVGGENLPDLFVLRGNALRSDFLRFLEADLEYDQPWNDGLIRNDEENLDEEEFVRAMTFRAMAAYFLNENPLSEYYNQKLDESEKKDVFSLAESDLVKGDLLLGATLEHFGIEKIQEKIRELDRFPSEVSHRRCGLVLAFYCLKLLAEEDYQGIVSHQAIEAAIMVSNLCGGEVLAESVGAYLSLQTPDYSRQVSNRKQIIKLMKQWPGIKYFQAVSKTLGSSGRERVIAQTSQAFSRQEVV